MSTIDSIKQKHAEIRDRERNIKSIYEIDDVKYYSLRITITTSKEFNNKVKALSKYGNKLLMIERQTLLLDMIESLLKKEKENANIL